MQRLSKLRSAVVLGGLLLVTSCIQDPEPLTASLPFAVSDYFVASGFIGDGEEGKVDAIVMTSDDDTCAPRPDGAEGTCYHFEYEPILPGSEIRPRGFGGVVWQSLANNWGHIPGRRVEPGARRVTFYARADREVVVEFHAATLRGTDPLNDGQPHPNQDPLDPEDANNRHAFTLTTEMTQYSFELPEGNDYTRVLGGFAWSMGAADARPSVALDIDDIRWEG